ncbi:MAG TPA: hypothetical protein VN253_21330, partial [Kofleriaceae bacterium]|nr:hypothetical protein [Kofleriaceae bacterium]
LAEHERDQSAEPAPAPAPPARAISRVLPPALLDFLVEQKDEDRYASVPELLRRAHQLGVCGRSGPGLLRDFRAWVPT